MMQNLLAERFHLAVHKEKRDGPKPGPVAGCWATDFDGSPSYAKA